MQEHGRDESPILPCIDLRTLLRAEIYQRECVVERAGLDRACRHDHEDEDEHVGRDDRPRRRRHPTEDRLGESHLASSLGDGCNKGRDRLAAFDTLHDVSRRQSAARRADDERTLNILRRFVRHRSSGAYGAWIGIHMEVAEAAGSNRPSHASAPPPTRDPLTVSVSPVPPRSSRCPGRRRCMPSRDRIGHSCGAIREEASARGGYRSNQAGDQARSRRRSH